MQKMQQKSVNEHATRYHATITILVISLKKKRFLIGIFFARVSFSGNFL